MGSGQEKNEDDRMDCSNDPRSFEQSILSSLLFSENCLKHFYLIDDRYTCAFAVFINLRGEMFVIGPSVSAFDLLGPVVKAHLILNIVNCFYLCSCFTTNVEINKNK